MRQLAISSAALFVVGCGIIGPSGSERRVYEVAAYKAGCTGVGPRMCLQVRDVGAVDFGNLFDGPSGFDYQWGHEYVIVVKERPRDELIADASSVVRTLDRVASMTPVAPGTTFEILVAAEGLRPSGTDSFTLFSEPVTIECVIAVDCADLATSLPSAMLARLTLRFPAGPGGALELLDWTVCAAYSDPCPSGTATP